MASRFRHPELPDEQAAILARAVRYEWLTIGYLALTIAAVGIVMGSSQALKTAWVEDLLSLAPPFAFLIATRIAAMPATARFPYGYFRATGVAHLVAGVALLTMGAVLVGESAISLVTNDRPPVGTVQLFGAPVWSGWLMIGVMALTIPVPVIFGRIKMKLARQLHNKVLYADADMNKADWMTAAGSIVGVTGIGLGFWWADSAAAAFIAASILWDGVKNTRGAITDLMDTRATTFDDDRPHPDAELVARYLQNLPWVDDVYVRVRDEGQFLHVEAFVVPRSNRSLTLERLEEARAACRALDWKLLDVVLTPVAEVPPLVASRSERRPS
ncbi:MAG TPA: cation transporter [Rhodoglobus sp.]|nr:cation transporter [Rhodoglobus sp.]